MKKNSKILSDPAKDNGKLMDEESDEISKK